MAYISLDPDGLQTIIDDLKSYATKTESNRVVAVEANRINSSSRDERPFDLFSFSTNLTKHKDDLSDAASTLQSRLDAAKAANETGMTTTAPDGTISYYLPDGMEDTTENVKTHNNVDAWAQAKADAATLVEYSENGCTVEEYEALLLRIQEKYDDPAYANTVLNTIGKGRLLDIPSDIEEGFTQADREWAGGINTSRPGAGLDIAQALGHILSTASSTWSDDKATEYANGLADRIEEKGKNKRLSAFNAMMSGSRDYDIDGDGSPEQIGLAYNDAMLITLGNRLENYDPEGQVWDLSSEEGGHFGFPGTLSGVVHAMTGNTAAAQSWLTTYDADKSVNTNGTAERTRNLMEQGGASTDDWTLIAAQSAVSSLNESDVQNRGPAQAAIVSGILNEVGSAQEPITLSETGRNAASIALASYPYGVQKATLPGDSDDPTFNVEGESWAADLAVQPTFTNSALSNLVGQIGQSDTAMARLAASQEIFNKSQIAGEAGKKPQGDGGNDDPFTTTLVDQSTARGFIAGALAKQSENDAAAADARVGAWANAASTAVSAIPIPQAKGAGVTLNLASQFAGSVGKSAAANGAKQGIYSFANKEEKAQISNQEIKNSAQKANTSLATLAVLHSGIYTQDELRILRKDNDGASMAPIIMDDGSLAVGAEDQSLSGDQHIALEEIAGDLDSTKYPALSGFRDRVENAYDKGYTIAQQKGS